MPTVIDSLIVTLGIDPSNFTEGQRQMANNLRQMEEGAQRAAANVQRSGSHVVSFFRTLESPITSLRQHFERLATYTATPQQNLLTLAQQGRRTGQEVESGALAGAAGLRAMGVAGLTAVAAFVALDKVKSAATDSARNLFGVGVGAAAAGLPIGEYTAISQALLHAGNVPEAETQGWLSQIRTAQIQAQHGDPAAAAALTANLAKIGVQANAFTDTPEQIMLAIANRFKSVSSDVAIGLGDMVGQSAALSLALHNLGAAGLEEQIQLERQRAATAGQSQAAKDLTEASNNLAVSWGNLTRILYEKIDPAFTRLDDRLSAILDLISGSETDKDRAVLHEWGYRLLNPGTWFHRGPQASTSSDTRNWWQRNAPTWLGGRADLLAAATPRSSNFTVDAGTSDVAAIRSAVSAAGGNEQTQAAFLAMFSPEDPGLNPSGTEEIPGSGGVGGRGGASYAQWTASRRRELESFGWTGTDPVKDRQAAAKMLYWELTAKREFSAMLQQMNAAGSATEAAKIGGRAFEQGGSPASMFGYRGGETQAGLDAFHSRQAESWRAAIRGTQAAQAGGGSTTSHSISNDVDINGGIHIHGADTGNGYKIGGAVNDAIHSQLLTNQINTGQE